MQVVCGLFRKITAALLISNYDVLVEVLGNRITNYLMAYFRKKALVLPRVKCVSVIESTLCHWI